MSGYSGVLSRPLATGNLDVGVTVFVQGKFLRVRRGCQASRERAHFRGSAGNFREVGKLPGKSGKPSGKSGKLPGKSGKLPGNPWIAVKFHSERTSGEVAEKLPGKFGGLPGKSGDFQKLGVARLPPSDPPNLSPICFVRNFNFPFSVSLVAQCSATPATVPATPPCSATPFQTQISVRHLPGMGGEGATPKFLGGVARHRCYTCKTL